MAKQLKKITLLSNALDIKSLRLALSELDLNSATKEDIALINAEIAKIIATLEVDDTSLDTLQEIVAFIKANKEILDTLTIDNIMGLRAALDSKADVTALTAVETALSQEIADLETAFATEIAGVRSEMAADKAALETAIGTVETSVETLATAVADNKAEIEATVAAETSAREAAVTAVTEEVAANKAEIETTVSDLTGVVTANKEEADTKISAETSARENAINEVTFGAETVPGDLPVYEEATHVAGDIVLDAEGNLCIVEETVEPVRKFRLKK